MSLDRSTPCGRRLFMGTKQRNGKYYHHYRCNNHHLNPVSAGFCYVPGGIVPLRDVVFRWFTCRKREYNCYVPASIAFGHPNTDLSGISLKPLLLNLYSMQNGVKTGLLGRVFLPKLAKFF